MSSICRDPSLANIQWFSLPPALQQGRAEEAGKGNKHRVTGGGEGRCKREARQRTWLLHSAPM
jgi:hypothetical protein